MTRTRIVVACIAVAALILAITPAGAHVGGTVGHLWTQHLLPLAKQTFYTKAKSDARYARRVTGKQHLMVVAAEWETDAGNDLQNVQTHGNTGGEICVQIAATDQFAYAPVHLPQGARVSSMDVDYVDDSSEFGANNAVISLVREPVRGSGLAPINLLTVTVPDGASPGQYGTRTTTLGTPKAINNATAGYMLHMFTTAAPHICNVDISYTLP
jgi:hypothetical protein